MEITRTARSEKIVTNKRNIFRYLYKTGRNRTLLSITYFIVFFNSSSALVAQYLPDNLESVMYQPNDVEKRSEAGLRYAHLMLDSSLILAISAVDSVINYSEHQEYALGVVRGQLLKSWILLVNVNYEGALRSAHKARTILEKGELDSLEMTRALNLLGLIYMEFNQFEKSMDYMKQTLAWVRLMRDSTKIHVAYNNLGALSKKQRKFKEAILYYQQSRKLRVLLGDSNKIAKSDINLGDTYLSLEQLDSASFYFERALGIYNRNTNKRGIPDVVHIHIGKYYIAIGNFEKAIHHIEKGLNHAIQLGHTDRWVNGYDLLSEALHKSGQKNSAYNTLKKRIALTDSLNKATNAAAIAEIEERYQSAKTEKKLLQSIAENLEKENEIMNMRFQNIGVVTIALLLIMGVVLFYWYRAQRRKVSQAGLQTALASTKLMALRAQMNSHFIFNSINTAQSFVSNSQKEKTYNYLSKFAKLLRGVLENSNSNFVPLENEIDLLKNYIDIETIRFNNKFSYDLRMEPVLENEVFEIPSMIIQPFVENAITHGLINLEEKSGCLSIKLSKHPQQILCEIEDNGVGRKRATEIKKRKQRYYKSQAFSNVKERLNLFSQQGETEVHFTVTDLFDANNQPAGTRAEIWLPFR